MNPAMNQRSAHRHETEMSSAVLTFWHPVARLALSSRLDVNERKEKEFCGVL